jgi:hypothetical protein
MQLARLQRRGLNDNRTKIKQLILPCIHIDSKKGITIEVGKVETMLTQVADKLNELEIMAILSHTESLVIPLVINRASAVYYQHITGRDISIQHFGGLLD